MTWTDISRVVNSVDINVLVARQVVRHGSQATRHVENPDHQDS